MYVIDEPTVGLHARDSERLLAVLKRLKNAGNTVIVVEHDPTIIAGADQTIELGPGAGEYGGSVLYVGPPRPEQTTDSLVPRPSSLSDSFGAITTRGAKEHTPKNTAVTIPLARSVAGTGGSGSA